MGGSGQHPSKGKPNPIGIATAEHSASDVTPFRT